MGNERLTTDRGRCLAVLAVVTPLGLLTKFYSGPGSSWVASQAGGFLYVVFWVFVALALFPRLSHLGVALAVATATSVLEFVQLWHPPFLERIRSSSIGHAVIGSAFAWSAFPYYAGERWPRTQLPVPSPQLDGVLCRRESQA